MNNKMLKFYIATKNKIEALVSDENGQDLIEYALLAALIALGVTALLTQVQGALVNVFTKISTELNAV